MPFWKKPSLEELEEEDNRLDKELSIAEKRAAIKEIQAKYGSGWRKVFSDNGVLNWNRIKAYLRRTGSSQQNEE